MREIYPDALVKGELRRLYQARYGEEPDTMALAAFTVVAQIAYQSAVDLRQWTSIMHDPKSRDSDNELPCGAVMMGRLRDLAEEAIENVKNTN